MRLMYRNETDKSRDLHKTVSQAEQEFAMDLKTFAVEVTADEKLLKTLFGAKHTCPNTRRIQTLPEAPFNTIFSSFLRRKLSYTPNITTNDHNAAT